MSKIKSKPAKRDLDQWIKKLRRVFPERFENKWEGVLYDTNPADRPAAEEALTQFFRERKKDIPCVEWLESPFQALLITWGISPRFRKLEGEVVISQILALWKDLIPRGKKETLMLPQFSLVKMFGRRLPGLPKTIREMLTNSNIFPESLEIRNQFFALDRILSVSMGDDFSAHICENPTLENIQIFTNLLLRMRPFEFLQNQLLPPLTPMEVDMIHETLPEFSKPYYPWFLKLGMNCGGLVLKEGKVFLIDRPEVIHRDEEGRFHCEDGPAIGYRDGWGAYSWHGMAVPRWVIEDQVTVEMIEREPNQEYRRIMLERMGLDKFLVDSGSQCVARDHCGELFVHEMPSGDPMVMVKVLNSSPEPDGTFRKYVLKVPPNIQTPRAAVAWTFGLEEEEYQPMVET